MTSQSSDDREKKLKIDVLLTEYQACHSNKNHFDMVRWTIGSIFIGASLTLFGLSFAAKQAEVLLAFVFSFLLIIVWYLYFQHVNPYVMVSIKRCHEIEKELRSMNFEIKLHKSIYEMQKKVEKKIRQPKGVGITFFLFFSIVGMWLWRITLFAQDSLGILVSIFAFAVIMVCFGILHRRFNAIKWSEEIRETSNVERAEEAS